MRVKGNTELLRHPEKKGFDMVGEQISIEKALELLESLKKQFTIEEVLKMNKDW